MGIWGRADMGIWDHDGVMGPRWGYGATMGVWGHGDEEAPSTRSYVMRMKEFERERRLLQRQRRIREREAAVAAE